MGRRSNRDMVLLAAPARSRHRRGPTVLQRIRLQLARLGCGRRARMVLGALAVAGLLLSGAALFLIQAPTRMAEASPQGADRAGQQSYGSGPIRDAGLWSMMAVVAPHAPPNAGLPTAAAGGTSTNGSNGSNGSNASVSALAASGIPVVAVQAYQNAAARADAANPACRISWPLIAAIGRIESNHGRTSGDLLTDGTSRPPVMGLLLDGSGGFATIPDTDGGRLDGSAQFDRAIGPLQFIPSTWAIYAADGNGDGITDPFNIFDASLGAATYLCRAGGDLSTPDGLQRAVFSYNHVQSYVDAVLALANEYAAQFNQGALPVTPVTGTPALPVDVPPATVGGPAPGADSIAPPSVSPPDPAPGDPSSIGPPAGAPGSAAPPPGSSSPGSVGSGGGSTAPGSPSDGSSSPGSPSDGGSSPGSPSDGSSSPGSSSDCASSPGAPTDSRSDAGGSSSAGSPSASDGAAGSAGDCAPGSPTADVSASDASPDVGA